ncbi:MULTISPECIES: DUF4290 domain-containing protein [Pedobacter]|uniref:Methionyl-tRNA formyltransferase n=1 Tax=Pedobacter heparinus (strain ATCC 13125 / DSM 2366 / CIP 104194 / JCM 7457 / NBRC 12017 / NCIMB 9290 / NRRL B-14731 / HIM 762-3) TaxID=485917 RepID=C6XT89_PEDHD|nr:MULTISPECIES: DUF4290 domain-containing protein [Pedobacter]ACU03650.1 hypothetical protein Phep_1436 [Pedobacter heparinus DSM 2366]MBB5436838.1 hypothetical protein [Pedobacter sp. AK017]
MNFEYNTTRNELILAEYGRNVQNMVKYIIELPDLEERNKYAQAVIDLMGFLNPHLRDVADFKHKLWDHLHIISGYKIDVDSPYPKPTPEAALVKPEHIGYPQQRITYKHYGKTVEMMIEKAKAVEEPERRAAMVQGIANFMKMAYVTWNKDSVADETILKNLRELSGGQLQLDENVNLNKVEFKPVVARPSNNNNNRGRNNGKGRQNNNNRPARNNNGKQRH